MKTKLFAAAMAVGLTIAGWSQSASAILYNVNKTIGAGGVTGSITTDGTIGVLSTGNITDWNLVLDDGGGTFNLLGPLSGANSQRLISGSAFSATAMDLLFDFSFGSGFVLFQNPTTGSGQNFWCIDNGGCINNFVPGETVRVGSVGETGHLLSGSQIIASASVSQIPEPGTLALLGFGLAGLGFARRRKAA